MLQSKKKITGKAVLIFLICLTSVEGFIERSRQNGGEATTRETQTLQNQRSTYGDLKPSNNGQERRISQHIYDKRSFRTGSIAHTDTRTERLLTKTEENIQEFRLQEDRRFTQPTYRLLNSRNDQTRMAQSEGDAIRTIREWVSTTEERRSASPSNNIERSSSLERRETEDTSRRHLEQQPIYSSRKDNSRTSSDTTRVSRISEEERRGSSRNNIEPNRASSDAASRSSLQRLQPNRRVLDSRVSEERERVELEDVRLSRTYRKLGTIREDSRESYNSERQPDDSTTRNNMRSSTVQTETNRHILDNTPDVIELARNRRLSERRSADYSDRRVQEPFRLTNNIGDRRSSIEVADDRRSSTVRVIDTMDRRQFFNNNGRNIDVTNANQIEEQARSATDRSSLGDRSRRYQPVEDRNREIDTRRTDPEDLNTNQIPPSSRNINDRQVRDVRLSNEERFTLRDEGITRREVPLSNTVREDRYKDTTRQETTSRLHRNSSRRVQLPQEASRDLLVYRQLENSRLRDSMRHSRQSRLSMDLTRRSSSRRDSETESSRQSQPLHVDRRSLQRSRSLEDTNLYRGVSENLLRQSRSTRIEALRPNREQNVVEWRSSEQSRSLKESRLSDEIREDVSRNSRQGSDSRMLDGERRDALRRMSFEDSRFSRDAREDRLTEPRLARVSRVEDARIFRDSRGDLFRESRQRENRRTRETSLSDRRNSRLSENTRLAREDFRDTRQDLDSRIDAPMSSEETRFSDRRTTLRSTVMSRESREDNTRRSRRTIEAVRQNEDRRISQRSLELSDYTRKLRVDPDYQREFRTDDRFNTRIVRQNFENHFRQTRSRRYREDSRRYRQNDLREAPRVADRRLDQEIRHTEIRQSDNRRAISSDSDSPRRETRIAYNNLMSGSNDTGSTLEFDEPLQQNDGQGANLGVWVEALKLALAVFLLGQIFVGSSEKYKLRIKNVISTLRLKKEKVQ